MVLIATVSHTRPACCHAENETAQKFIAKIYVILDERSNEDQL